MFGKTRDGDLPPGVYERDPISGVLHPTTKVLTNDPPRPINIAPDGTITNVTNSDIEYLRDVVTEHKELLTGHSITTSRSGIQKIRDFCMRVADSVMEKK